MRRRLQSPLFPLFQVQWIDEFQILCKFCVFQRQYIIYISVGEIELLCEVFLACLEEIHMNGYVQKYERISTDERSIVNTHSIDITAKFAVSIKEKT